MDAVWSFLVNVREKFSYLWGSSSSAPVKGSAVHQNETESSETSNEHDIPVTKPPSTPKNIQERSPAPSPVNSHSDHPQIPSHQGFDETSKVDKINLKVKSAGKSLEVEIFPLESISVLLKQACELARKKPEKMRLVYDGNHLDMNKTVSQYGLRGGTTVHLIHA